MNALRVVYKNKERMANDADAEFKKWADELLKEQRASDIRKAEKKYGVNLDHRRRKFNIE